MKKILPYILILFIFVGLLGPINKIYALDPLGSCTKSDGGIVTDVTKQSCKTLYNSDTWTANASGKAESTALENSTSTAPPPATDDKTEFEKLIEQKTCGVIGESSLVGCALQLSFIIFYQIPAFLLLIVAQLFNALASITLSTELYRSSSFLGEAWKVVRDVSNIFFILMLIYIAIQTILGIGGHGAKKAIGAVVVAAMLINFSMFFTEVVIDTSNVLALIFYNKTSVTNIDKDGKERPYVSTFDKAKTGIREKDLAGGIVQAFNPTRLMTADMFKPSVDAKGITKEVPMSFYFFMIFLTGAVMLFASYAFFVSGFSLLGRLIELWVLIIFSPFALMSFAVPKLSKVSKIGWDEWISGLIRSAFMAPIFFFFIYLISKMVQVNLFKNMAVDNGGQTQMILMIVVPALIYLVMLLKATEFAKKGSGQFGEMVINGAKMAAVLGVGVATGGAALAGRAVAGRAGAALSRTDDAMHYGSERFKWENADKTTRGEWKDHMTANGVKGSPLTVLGGKINASQRKVNEIDHARHEIDEVKKKAGLEGVADTHLSGVDKEKIETTFVKDKRKEIEEDIKKGYDAKGKAVKLEDEKGKPLTLKDENGQEIKDSAGNSIPIVDKQGKSIQGENAYKATRREAVTKEVGQDPKNIDASTGDLTDQAKKMVEDKLSSEFNTILKDVAGQIGKQKYAALQHETQEKVGILTRVAAKSTSGSYDIRNITTKVDKREGLSAKATVGLIAAVALGMRLGFKHGADVDVGAGQKDFLKDMGSIITNSLKHVKINASGVVKEVVGHGDDHGGGGHH